MITKIKNKVKDYQKYLQTKKELESLTRKELADIGISRSDIKKVAQKSVFTS